MPMSKQRKGSEQMLFIRNDKHFGTLATRGRPVMTNVQQTA